MRIQNQTDRLLKSAIAAIEPMEPRRLLSTTLTGTIIGTPGSYQNDGNTIAKVFDGKLTTYFDGPTNSGDYAGLNLGSAKIITQISFAPRSGWASRMVGGLFRGSNSADFSSGVTTLYTVTKAPTQGALTTVPITNYNAFEFVRYTGPAGSFGNVAEVQFYGSTPTPGPTLESNGTLVVNGTANADTITVGVFGDEVFPTNTVTTTLNGITNAFPMSAVSQIIINAGAGADTVTLNGSNNGADDEITQVFNAITVNGDDGDDQLSNNIQVSTGATESILMDGDIGNDYLFDGGSDRATLIGGDGNDTFNSDGYPNLSEFVYGGAGNDTIWAEGDTVYPVYDGGAGTNTIDYAHHANSVDGDLYLNLSTFVNVHNVILGDEPATIIGTSGDDTITGDSEGNDVSILGGGGNDTVSISNAVEVSIDASGSGGSNIKVSNANDVTVTGGDGNDTINVIGASGNVVINGGAGNDTLSTYGTGPADNNDANNVIINGGDGNDTIYGFAVTAVINGGSGNDSIYFDGSYSLDIEGGDGNDTLSGSGGILLINGGAGNDAIATTSIESIGYQSFSAIVNGGAGNDTINTLDGDTTTIDGEAGTDIAFVDSFDIVTNTETVVVGNAAAEKQNGQLIGTAGSYHNLGNTIANAFDGDLTTYFDGPVATGNWVSLDLGTPQIVTQVKFASRPGWESRMVGGEIQASNTANFSSGVVTLFTINSTPASGVLSVQSLTNSTAYRYYRYLSPANSYGDIAELEFDG